MKKKTTPTVRAYSEQLFQQLHSNGQIRTARAYRGAVNQLTIFLGKEDLSFEEIDTAMMKDFQKYFLDRGRRMNTVSFYMRQLRSVSNQAIKASVFLRNGDPFEDVFTGNAATIKRALNLQEISDVANFEIELLPPSSKAPAPSKSQKDLVAAQQYLRFTFHARGISFVDLCFLRKSDVHDEHIHYLRKKTGKEIVLHINKEMQAIMNRFADQVKDSPYLFPLLDIEKPNLRRQYETALDRQNKLLKQLGKLAGLKRPLTTHVVRHSWATIALRKGASVSMICQALGHSDERTTAIYLDSFKDPAMRRLSNKVSGAIAKK